MRAIMDRTPTCRNNRFGRLCAFVVLGASAHASSGRAQSSPEPGAIHAHLIVEGDERCATKTALAARVHERSPRIQFDEAPDDVPALRVHVEAGSAGRRVLQLSIHWPDGQRAERHLTAKSCASGLDALALLVAMTLDPDTRAAVAPTPLASSSDTATRDEANGEPVSPPGEPGAVAPGATSGTDSSAAFPPEQQEAAHEPSTEQADAIAPEPTAIPADQPVDLSPPQASTPPGRGDEEPHPFGVEHAVVGINGQLVWRVAPEAMPGLGVHALLAFHGGGAWAPALALQLAHAWVSGLREPGGHADFALDSAELDACPLGLRFRPLAARTCATGTVGRVTAVGSETYEPQTQAKLWASIGGAALLSVDVGAWIELQGGFALTAPLRRYGFAFTPELFHRVPVLCFRSYLGVGYRFP